MPAAKTRDPAHPLLKTPLTFEKLVYVVIGCPDITEVQFPQKIMKKSVAGPTFSMDDSARIVLFGSSLPEEPSVVKDYPSSFTTATDGSFTTKVRSPIIDCKIEVNHRDFDYDQDMRNLVRLHEIAASQNCLVLVVDMTGLGIVDHSWIQNGGYAAPTFKILECPVPSLFPAIIDQVEMVNEPNGRRFGDLNDVAMDQLPKLIEYMRLYDTVELKKCYEILKEDLQNRFPSQDFFMDLASLVNREGISEQEFRWSWKTAVYQVLSGMRLVEYVFTANGPASIADHISFNRERAKDLFDKIAVCALDVKTSNPNTRKILAHIEYSYKEALQMLENAVNGALKLGSKKEEE
jgi:hypothetical protein